LFKGIRKVFYVLDLKIDKEVLDFSDENINAKSKDCRVNWTICPRKYRALKSSSRPLCGAVD